MGLRNKRPRALNYYVNKKGAKSGNKIDNCIRHYKSLLIREGEEGNTKWLENAKKIVLAKFRKYSININKI